jgi:hypothetical protein
MLETKLPRGRLPVLLVPLVLLLLAVQAVALMVLVLPPLEVLLALGSCRAVSPPWER